MDRAEDSRNKEEQEAGESLLGILSPGIAFGKRKIVSRRNRDGIAEKEKIDKDKEDIVQDSGSPDEYGDERDGEKNGNAVLERPGSPKPTSRPSLTVASPPPQTSASVAPSARNPATGTSRSQESIAVLSTVTTLSQSALRPIA